MAGEWEFEKGRVLQGVARRGRRIYKGPLVLRSGAHSVQCTFFNLDKTRIEMRKNKR